MDSLHPQRCSGWRWLCGLKVVCCGELLEIFCLVRTPPVLFRCLSMSLQMLSAQLVGVMVRLRREGGRDRRVQGRKRGRRGDLMMFPDVILQYLFPGELVVEMRILYVNLRN